MKCDLTKRQDFEAQALPKLENLYRTVLYVLDNEAKAQECIIESFARAYNTWNEHPFSTDCRLWLFKIAAEVIITKYQSSPNLSLTIDDICDLDGYPTLSQLLSDQQTEGSKLGDYSLSPDTDFRSAIRNIPDEFKLVVVLSLIEHFSYREIAAIAGIDISTVRLRLHHGRKLLQGDLFAQVALKGDYSATTSRIGRRRTG